MAALLLVMCRHCADGNSTPMFLSLHSAYGSISMMLLS